MGYRNYIGIAKKSEVEELMTCQTNEDRARVYSKYGWDFEKFDDGDYFPVYKLNYREEYEFGKYVNMGDAFYGTLKEIFPKESPLYDHDCEFLVGDENTILEAIERYRTYIRDYFENLLKTEPDDDNIADMYDYNKLSDTEKDRWHYNILLNAVKNKADEWSDRYCLGWGVKPYNLNKDYSTIVSSWKYEYTIFELVRIYKSFDPETEVVVYFGY